MLKRKYFGSKTLQTPYLLVWHIAKKLNYVFSFETKMKHLWNILETFCKFVSDNCESKVVVKKQGALFVNRTPLSRIAYVGPRIAVRGSALEA